MALLVITLGDRVQLVALDDPSPRYGANYVRAVARYLDPDAGARFCEVDVSTVAEFGPNDIARMLQGEDIETDLPQQWEKVKRS